MKNRSTISGRWTGRRGGGATCVITEITEHAAPASLTTDGPVTGQYLLVDQEPATRISQGRYSIDTPGGEVVTCDDATAP
jgi:hypothetical protein